MQNICDQILIISKGRLVAFDTPDNLEKQMLSHNEITLTAEGGAEQVSRILAGVENITDMRLADAEDGHVTVRLQTDSGDIREVSRAIFFAFAGAGVALLELALKKATLEDVFLELTEQNGEEDAEEKQEGTEQ